MRCRIGLTNALSAVIVVCVLLACRSALAAEAPRVQVGVKGADFVSIIAVDAPMVDVLQELARQLGAKISGRSERSEPVRCRLIGLKLEHALRRLLGSQSFAIVYGTGDSGPAPIVEIRLLATEGSGWSLPSAGASTTAQAPTDPDAAHVSRGAAPLRLDAGPPLAAQQP